MNLPSSLTPVRITTAVILMTAVVASFGGWVWLMTSPVATVGGSREFTVQPGWGGGRIASELQRAGLIRSSFVMILVTNWTGTGDSLQAGTYLLSPDMTTPDIVRILAEGDTINSDITITVPEGMNVWEIDDLLAEQGRIIAGSFSRQYQDSEGLLWPDTYRFDASVASGSREYADATVFGVAFLTAQKQKVSAYTNEQIIVASILEKEAKSVEDMALVAGIIVNRRELGMALQIDATVAYGWCLRRWQPMSSMANCDVTQAPIASETKVDGPYNTYTRTGLPDGAISNPGLRALDAAQNPKDSDYLYYLSTRDGSQIIYSRTLEEHNSNRAKYLGL